MTNVPSFDGTSIAFVHHAARTPNAITAVIAACQGAAFNRFEEVMRKTTATAVMDMRGSGASARPKSKWDFSVPAYAKDIAAVIDATKAHKAALVSYSHASEGAVHLAITQPHKVAALVFIEPGLFVSRARLLERVKIADDGRIDEALRLALSFANPGLTGKELEEGAQFVLNTYGNQPENIVGEWRARAEYRVSDKQLAQISVPTLVIGGTHSNIRDDVARTAAAIPNASLFWLRGATHFLNEEQGKTAAEITSSFLSHAL